MHLHYLFELVAIIRCWLGRERAVARCVVKTRRRLSMILLLAVAASARLATASVLINGNVLPVDNPFSPNNEGLPSDGNFVNQFATPIANQQNYEGILVGTTQVLIPTITVGQTSFGTLTINGESELRDEDLIIGSFKPAGGNNTAIGSGVVRITGSGSLFNSDPAILSPDAYAASTPPPPPIPSDPAFIVPVSAFQKRSLTQGYDLIVGQAGTGTLEVSAGGRGEIQDAIVAGESTGSTGSIVVDGIDSYLGQGANMPPGSLTPSPTDPHGTIIGQQGIGVMTITNGGTVESNITGGQTSNGPVVAGSIGSVPFVQGSDNTTSGAGGSGTVTVDGVASKWISHGSLQVGGFIDIPGAAATTPTDITGDTSLYTSKFGQGILNVQNGAIVNVASAVGTTDTTTNPLYFVVGHFGTINMNGGLINIGELNTTGGASNSQSRGPNNQLVNDGVIQGTGTIQTGVFRNRHLGTIRVLAGQNLIISASSEFTTGSIIPDQLPLQNYGTIQALGSSQAYATLEFVRPNTGDTTRPVTRFQNFRLNPTAAIPVQGGVISAQWSTLHFDSGLNNFGVLAFTAGDNYVTGDVFNQSTGTIFANGPGTRVTFQDDLNCGLGACSFAGVTVNVIKGLTFISAGNLTVSPTSLISTAGNAGITGGLTVNLSNVPFGSLHEGDVFQILSVTGSIGGVDLSDPTTPKVDLTIPGRFSNLFLPSLTSIGLPATDKLIPFYTSNGVYLAIESLGAASGPDFNGDGVVNGLDLQVWLANVGIQSGATVIQGDANGDGKVDGNDFLIWQRSRGAFPGAGSGLAGGSATVPEPASLALVLMGAIAALPIRRRKAG
jgi:hypothetical protein